MEFFGESLSIECALNVLIRENCRGRARSDNLYKDLLRCR
jgi:hypothetical protein